MNFYKKLYLKIFSFFIKICFSIFLPFSIFTFFGYYSTNIGTLKSEYEYSKQIRKNPLSSSLTTFNTSSNSSFSKNHYWTTNYGYRHWGSYRISDSDYYSSVRARKESGTYDEWNMIYLYVIKNDMYNLDNIFSIFDRIQRDKNYSTYEFADLIVSFVQDIPYAYTNNDWPDLYAPVEFLRRYQGDCDTRTVLLFILLNGYGIDTVILGSSIYKHSVIGVNLPTSSGSYKYANGKRYYLWETTAKGWTRGDISPRTKNMNYWKIDLKL